MAMPRPLPPNQLESLDQSCIGILVTLWKTSRVNHCPIFLSSSTIFPIHCIFFSQTMFEILCFFSSLLCTLSILLLIQLFFSSIPSSTTISLRARWRPRLHPGQKNKFSKTFFPAIHRADSASPTKRKVFTSVPPSMQNLNI